MPGSPRFQMEYCISTISSSKFSSQSWLTEMQMLELDLGTTWVDVDADVVASRWFPLKAGTRLCRSWAGAPTASFGRPLTKRHERRADRADGDLWMLGSGGFPEDQRTASTLSAGRCVEEVL